MRVRVLAFARVRELLGGARHELELEEGASAGDVWDMLALRSTALLPLSASTRIARNGEIVGADEPLRDGDELCLLPPVGGG